MPLPSRESLRKRLPAAAGEVIEFTLDNPAQCAVIVSAGYVITTGLARLVRPYGLPGIVAVSAVSYVASRWLVGEAIDRGLLEFRTRHPVTGELVTLAELDAELAAIRDVFDGEPAAAAPLIDLDAIQREVDRRAGEATSG